MKNHTILPMELWLKVALTVAIVLIEVIALGFMWGFRKTGNINHIVDAAVEKSQFQPTVFRIYDKSTTDVCNRLIIVDPFEWHIWAVRSELYILNPESGIKCSSGSMPAIQVYYDQFVETCIAMSFDSILDTYTRGQIPKIVSYEFAGTTFTILSALNILVKDWVTFDITTVDIKRNLIQVELEEDDQPIRHRVRRQLQSSDVIQLTNQTTTSSTITKIQASTLQRKFQNVLNKAKRLGKFNLSALHRDDTPTKRQHRHDHHLNLPKQVGR